MIILSVDDWREKILADARANGIIARKELVAEGRRLAGNNTFYFGPINRYVDTAIKLLVDSGDIVRAEKGTYKIAGNGKED